MVFYNDKYKDIGAAKSKRDGLVVIGVMAEVVFQQVQCTLKFSKFTDFFLMPTLDWLSHSIVVAEQINILHVFQINDDEDEENPQQTYFNWGYQPVCASLI